MDVEEKITMAEWVFGEFGDLDVYWNGILLLKTNTLEHVAEARISVEDFVEALGYIAIIESYEMKEEDEGVAIHFCANQIPVRSLYNYARRCVKRHGGICARYRKEYLASIFCLLRKSITREICKDYVLEKKELDGIRSVCKAIFVEESVTDNEFYQLYEKFFYTVGGMSERMKNLFRIVDEERSKANTPQGEHVLPTDIDMFIGIAGGMTFGHGWKLLGISHENGKARLRSEDGMMIEICCQNIEVTSLGKDGIVLSTPGETKIKFLEKG